jgi:hypothetical protein
LSRKWVELQERPHFDTQKGPQELLRARHILWSVLKRFSAHARIIAYFCGLRL